MFIAKMEELFNRSFPGCLLPLCQNGSLSETIHMEMCFLYRFISCKSNSFSYERLCTKTHFETEAQGNSGLAYCPEWDTVP